MEKIDCLFCNHSNAQQVIYENDYFGKQCNDCSLIYISPRPSVDDVIDIYGHNQAQVSAQTHIQGNYLKRLYARHTLKIIKKFISKGSVLEIGAGGGYFLDEARSSGFKAFGLELNSLQASFIQNDLNIPCEQKPLSATSFGDRRFDLIYHCDVISHFHDPIKEFKSMFSKLKPGGFVVFETGNIGDIEKNYYHLFPAFQYPDHLFFFTLDNLKCLLEQTGFKLCKTYYYSIVPQLIIQQWLKNLFNKKQSNTSNYKNETTKKQNYKATLTKKIYYQLLYTLRYKLGAIVPKYKRPQTLIIVGQKTL